jgi:adenine/guanine phosphoribosyltransferase-like PRPP-binding protein
MEITLEKIELVKDRTGVTYKEAKEALEAADGSVIDAIIAIEETVNFNGDSKSASHRGEELFSKIKETANKGNMSRIMVKKDDQVLLNFPLTVSLIGAVIAPWGVIFGAIAAVGFNCKVEFIRDDGKVVDVSGKVVETYEDLKSKGAEAYNDIKEKGSETFEDLKEKGSETFEDLKGKANEKFKESKKEEDEAEMFDFGDDLDVDIEEELKKEDE